MPLISLDIPAGIYRHGTDLESANRWRDANFIRWENNAVRPIGGWQQRENITVPAAPVGITINAPARGALAWVDNSANPNLAAGTYEKLWHISASGVATDITPAGYVAGTEDSDPNIGFGGYYFGLGLFGTERPSNSIGAEATTWSVDTWGEYLVACANSDGKIYEWTLNPAAPAAVIANAPIGCNAILVTEDRFLFALAPGGNPRKIQWCDREDNTDWTPTALNQAGDIELQTSGEIQLGVNTRGRALILTTTDAHVASYSGPPVVYGFERVGTACGAISRHCAVAIDEGAYWMGYNGFFAYNGSAVVEMPCDVHDYVFKDINRAEQSKVNCVDNSQYNELWWFYPSGGSNENDRYVIYDYKENHWNIGQLARTACTDIGVFTNPIWFAPDGKVYNQEFNFSHGQMLPFLESGPISIGNGNDIMKVNEVIPDESNLGDVTLTFKTRFYPTDTEYSYGPYTMLNPTGVRFQGRQIRMRMTGVELIDWKVGTMRINAMPGGSR
tara:strand:- start:1584 stop:3089 length:1506 start_codon:yes stop_codon:yes gene_type:complete